jgi:isopenicillin N synthase-like dioxygenase
LRLLPLYAKALQMEKNYFAPAFTHPFYRLRMTHYPARPESETGKFGISPHVDTTFFTLLAQDSPGLVVFSELRQCWIAVPMIENAFIVNTGELLKHWSNDEFISVKHFANNIAGHASRYSIPFFFNANTDYKMTCIPSCCGPDRPAKYPAISYDGSQGVTQGE